MTFRLSQKLTTHLETGPHSTLLRLLCLAMAVFLSAAGCDRQPSTQPAPATAPAATTTVRPELQIQAKADGSLVVDGKPCTLADLDQRLGELAKANGEVWWYREDPASEPAADVKEAFRLIVQKHRLPVGISTKPDFSDSLDRNGVSRPRR